MDSCYAPATQRKLTGTLPKELATRWNCYLAQCHEAFMFEDFRGSADCEVKIWALRPTWRQGRRILPQRQAKHLCGLWGWRGIPQVSTCSLHHLCNLMIFFAPFFFNFHIRKNVVPHEYRKYFPAVMKDHQSHDVLLMWVKSTCIEESQNSIPRQIAMMRCVFRCVRCHQVSNLHDSRLRQELADECGAPITSTSRTKVWDRSFITLVCQHQFL